MGNRVRSMTRRALSVSLAMISSVVFIGGCSSTGGTAGNTNLNASTNGFTADTVTLSGRVEAGDFTLDAGRTITVTGDLELIATGDVFMVGDLLAEDNPEGDGYNISITADGDITVEGTIQTGAPAQADAAVAGGKTLQTNAIDLPGHSGGSLNIRSERGNLSIGRNSTLIAFDGTDAIGGVTGAPGGNGGSVSLCASYGTLSMRGSVFLGNGGYGGDANLDTETMEKSLPDGFVLNDYRFKNAGGDSGQLAAFAATWDWPTLEFYGNFVEDIGRSPALDPNAYAAEASTGIITGGIGGNAGLVIVTDDPAKLAERIEEERSGAEVETFNLEFKVTGAAGGRGWYAGGVGGTVTVYGLRWNGRDGADFKGTGGAGGELGGKRDPTVECGAYVPAIGGIAGTGGGAGVTSPGGIPPVTARGEGNAGSGGRAVALGGAGGQTNMEVYQTGGQGGFANAIAGAGADGLSSCFANDVGSGGDGGGASAIGGDGGDGKNHGEGGLAEAIAGEGGSGGNGDGAAGSAGRGGDAYIKLGADGSTGEAGEVISTGAEFEEKAADGDPGDTEYLAAPDYCADVDYLCPDGQLCGN